MLESYPIDMTFSSLSVSTEFVTITNCITDALFEFSLTWQFDQLPSDLIDAHALVIQFEMRISNFMWINQ